MPTLPKTTVARLGAVTPGSLVSLKDHTGKLVFGLCAILAGEEDDPKEVGLVALTPVEGGIVAAAIPIRGGATWIVNGNSRVTNHGNGYSINVRAKDWDGDHRQRTFAPTDAGLLLFPEAGDLSLAVSLPWAGGCDLLNLRNWTLGRAGVSLHVAAKKWSLSLPWTGDDLDWPLGAP
jgi:hypothetical protein